MKLKPVLKTNLKLTFAVTITLLVGVFCTTSTYAHYNQNPSSFSEYPKNKHGQTYGIGSDASYHGDKEPNLIKALGDDGKTTGYVLATDLNGFQPKNPKEAIEWQKKNKGPRVIPLYDVNGEKIIGTFTVGSNQSSTINCPIAAKSFFTMKASSNKVEDFLKLQTTYKSSYKDDKCYNITPDFISQNSPFTIFKYDKSCETFLLYENKLYPIGIGWGGFGITSMALADINNDGKQELYFTFSFGSGIHRSKIGYFDSSTAKQVLFNDIIWNEDAILTTDSNNNLCVGTANIKLTNFVDFEISQKDTIYHAEFKNNAISLVSIKND